MSQETSLSSGSVRNPVGKGTWSDEVIDLDRLPPISAATAVSGGARKKTDSVHSVHFGSGVGHGAGALEKTEVADGSDSDSGLEAEAMIYDQMKVLRELDDDAGRRESLFANNRMRPPADLSFHDLTFSVGDRVILNKVSGEAKKGQVLAIMGASGAGKTTLLHMLAGRLVPSKTGKTSGAVNINGRKRDFDSFRQMSAYVLQEDSFFPELTVKETVTLAALLRLPREMPEESKHQRVEQVITELGLTKCQNTIVGNALVRGISGGEKKRLNIATELVTDPSLVFLDEPTTGLDSFSAQSIMQTLLRLAQNSRTVIATIHQPRSSIYQMFDMLMLLSEGRVMYYGTAVDALPYFNSLGYDCPETYNPADFFLDFLSLDQRSANLEKVSRARVKALGDAYAAKVAEQRAKTGGTPPTSTRASGTLWSEKDGNGTAHQLALKDDDAAAGTAEEKALWKRKYATSFFYQFTHLLRRSVRSMMREKATNIAIIAQSIMFSVLLGLIWLRQGNSLGGSSVQAIAGVLFFLLVNQSFSCTFSIIYLFPAERLIVLKERASRQYHVGAYFWSKSIADLPRSVALCLLFCIVTYLMVSLRSGAEHFFAFFVIVFLTQKASESIAYCVSAVASGPQQAGALSPVFIVTSMLFCGYFIPLNDIPVWLRWINYISFIRYGFALAMQNEFEGRTLLTNCGSSSFCPRTGEEVLAFYNIDEIPYWANFLILMGLTVGLRLVAYFFLRIRGPKYDRSL